MSERFGGCHSCEFWRHAESGFEEERLPNGDVKIHPHPKETASGNCHRYAPKPRWLDERDEAAEWNIHWPETSYDDGCGDWSMAISSASGWLDRD